MKIFNTLSLLVLATLFFASNARLSGRSLDDSQCLFCVSQCADFNTTFAKFSSNIFAVFWNQTVGVMYDEFTRAEGSAQEISSALGVVSNALLTQSAETRREKESVPVD